MIGFYAKDEASSLRVIPESRNVLPEENLVVSIEGSVQITKQLKVNAEYASTAITKDTRAENTNNGRGVAALLFNNKASTEYYKAIKAVISYSFEKATFGIGYEPRYRTIVSCGKKD